MNRTAYNTVVEMMPGSIAEKLMLLDGETARSATEIRLRAGRPCTVCAEGQTRFIDAGGEPLTLSQDEIRGVVAHMCEYSLYQREDELRQGYVTVKGGHRIGVCASYLQNGTVDAASISSASIRIAREHRGCAAEVFGSVMMEGPRSVLLAGPPLCGKTTLLRDLARILAGHPLYRKVAVIDERGELAGMCGGRPALDVGICSDVLDGYPRALGFEIALRTLSPEIIVCDELGGEHDFGYIESAARSGVRVLASAHAGDMDGLMRKKPLARIIDSGVFDYIVLLEGAPHIGAVKLVSRVVGA